MQPIFHAILQNELPAFLSLVEERDSWLEERNDEQHSNTVLHMAAKHGRGEFVSKIIELRPSLICSRNAYGNTPLHLAALLGDVNIIMTMLEFGPEACSARNNNNQTPLHLACRSNSVESATLFAEKIQSVGLHELNFAILSGMAGIAGTILERFPDLAREEAWPVQGGSLSSLLHHACDRGDLELTRILLGLDERLDEALDTNGLSPLHLAVLRGSVVILEEFLNTAPLSFYSLTPSKDQILLQQTDEDGNTVLHVAASVACGAPFVHYIRKRTDKRCKNNIGFAAYQLIPQEAVNFELLSRWLRFDTETPEELNSEEYDGHSRPIQQQSLGRVKSLAICGSSDADKVIRLLTLIGINTTTIAERKRKSKQSEVEKGRESLEYEMHIEALQNARNTIAIVAVLIASVTYAGGINPPGGVYQDGPWKGKSTVGKTTAFKVFAICNNIALFTSLAIVILLVSVIPYKRKPLKRLLVATHRMMWVSIGFMAASYIAASWVTIPHYHGTRWLFPAIIAVGGGALIVLFSYLLVQIIGHWFKKLNRVGDIPSFARTCSDLAVSGKSGYFIY
ncbi:hypothetical protein F2Q68_00040593 [Brassica cretica]|uniref:PGG domain-containing protein n=1 Tax=Brassica cretica TaxID=69181 RepID=A0A8S9MTL9_BRACR|nr:hypothetical protein F2Q68_00040593 [Brassica cretica]